MSDFSKNPNIPDDGARELAALYAEKERLRAALIKAEAERDAVRAQLMATQRCAAMGLLESPFFEDAGGAHPLEHVIVLARHYIESVKREKAALARAEKAEKQLRMDGFTNEEVAEQIENMSTELASLRQRAEKAEAVIKEQNDILFDVGPITCVNKVKHDIYDGCLYCRTEKAEAVAQWFRDLLRRARKYMKHEEECYREDRVNGKCACGLEQSIIDIDAELTDPPVEPSPRITELEAQLAAAKALLREARDSIAVRIGRLKSEDLDTVAFPIVLADIDAFLAPKEDER